MSAAWSGALHVHHTPMKLIHDDVDGVRWCFVCRKRAEFRYQVHATVEPSYYDPNPSVVCAICGTVDGDMFPGCSREWTEAGA